MRRIHPARRVLTVALFLSMPVRAIGGDCPTLSLWYPLDICDSVEMDGNHFTYRVHYHGTNDDGVSGCDDGSYLDTSRAWDIVQSTIDAESIFDGWGFAIPVQNSVESTGYFDIAVYEIGSGSTAVTQTVLTLYDTSHRSSCVDDDYISLRVAHELFHAVQLNYAVQIGGSWDGSEWTWGDWVWEGTASTIEDRIATWADAEPAQDGFRAEIAPFFNNYKWNDSLCDLAYSAALFWSYCCEQYGSPVEPASGIDFLHSFFIYSAADDTFDAISVLDKTIGVFTGGDRDLDDTFSDFAICTLSKDLDLSVLSDPTPFSFVDENQYGEGAYGSVAPFHVEASGFRIVAGPRDEYASDYYSSGPFDSVGACEAVGFRVTSDEVLAMAALPVTDVVGAATGPSGQLTQLVRTRDREFGATFIRDASGAPIEDLYAVVATLGQGAPGGHEISYDSGPVALSINEPSADYVAHPGPSGDPGRLLVRAVVDGPEGLKPDGIGERSVLGLTASQFGVAIGGVSATVLSADYVGGEYWLVVEAPPQPADGVYDLELSLCGSVVRSAAASVEYGPYIVDHVIVIDASGSMGAPVGSSKLDAARVAARLYAAAVGESDGVGLVSFTGNGFECDYDATIETPLSTATDAHRRSVEVAANALAAAGFTSIGDGVLFADDLLAAPSPANEKRVILLSDGQENEGHFWNQAHPAGCLPAVGVRDQIDPSIRISAIALGAEADQDLMQQIADDTHGQMSYVDVPSASPAMAMAMSSGSTSAMSLETRLADAFLDMLAGARQAERVNTVTGTTIGGTTTVVPLEIAEDNLTDASIVVNVAVGGLIPPIRVRTPAGTLVPLTTATVHRSAANTHAVWNFLIPPKKGTWIVEIQTPTPSEYLVGFIATNRHGPSMTVGFDQVRTGGSTGLADGSFEQGVPVRIVAMLTDSDGPILDASVRVEVVKPDGSISCGTTSLNDDGEWGDRYAGDGAYAARYVETYLSGGEGLDADDPQGNTPPAPPAGTYVVTVTATGVSNTGSPFERTFRSGFQVDTSADLDGDFCPDTWEVYYGTDPNDDDGDVDYDDDLVIERDEAVLGTHPFDADTDGDGESDDSERDGGLCSLDPADGRIGAPIGVSVMELDPRKPDVFANELVRPGVLSLRFPWRPGVERVEIRRAVGQPVHFPVVAALEGAQAERSMWTDETVVPGETYFYKVVFIGPDGAVSRASRVVSAIPAEPPCPGDLTGDGRTDASDFFTLASFFGTGPWALPEMGDLNGDGWVNSADFSVLALGFGCVKP